ncbi:MAG: helix-turn-helix transcriptional regulator [Clostridia bacterium]|nr:helix-turn-helix transcriptional regulator [Clostridia bacterium]
MGDNIARYRRQAGLTQDELGSRCCVSAQAVSKWERCIACPDVMLLPVLAEALGVTLDELFAPPTQK